MGEERSAVKLNSDSVKSTNINISIIQRIGSGAARRYASGDYFPQRNPIEQTTVLCCALSIYLGHAQTVTSA